MKFSKKYLLILTIFLFSASGLATAANYYVRAGATGSGDGSDWTNAYTSLPATLNRGSTYYIADGSYPGYTFNDSVSGTTLIYIKKAIASDHGTDTGWSSSYGDGIATLGSFTFETSYWVIDGQTGGGPGSWESGFGIKLTPSESKIVRLNNNAGNITLAHIDMEHNGRHTHNSNEDILYGLGASENITISYCYLHDVARCHLLTTNTDGFTIEYSKIARNGAGGDSIHREAWSAQVDDNVIVRYNIFEDISNTGIICLVNGNGDAENWQIYGNVFWRSPGDLSGTSSCIQVKYASPTFVSAVNWKVYNNVIVNLKGLGAGLAIQNGSGNVAKNNIWYNNNVNTVQLYNTSHDYNWFENNYRTDGCDPPCDLDPDLADSETNGIHGSADPFVDWENDDFDLTSGTDARDNGTDLGTSYDQDAYGNTRGADGYWDIGAYEYIVPPMGDFTGDYVVDFEDLKILTDDWLVTDYVLTGLVSHYKFDGDANDSVNGNHGTEVGDPCYAPGMHGQAISLDGSGDYVDCGNDSSFDITGSITLSALIKGTFNSNWDPIISKGFNWQLTRGMGNEASFFCIGLGSLLGTTNINDDQWHHVAGVYNGSKMDLYVDGQLDASKSTSGSLSFSSSNVYIGGSPSASFNGLIDDVRIYDRALSADEIRTLYFGPATDLVNDYNINFRDFAILANNWLVGI